MVNITVLDVELQSDDGLETRKETALLKSTIHFITLSQDHFSQPRSPRPSISQNHAVTRKGGKEYENCQTRQINDVNPSLQQIN